MLSEGAKEADLAERGGRMMWLEQQRALKLGWPLQPELRKKVAEEEGC